MDEIIQYVTSHQFTVAAVFLSVCLFTYLLFGKFFKLALAIVIVIVGLCVYFYIQDPATVGERIGNIWGSVKEKTVKVTESSNDAYTKGKEYIEKGKKVKDEAVEKILDHPKEEQGAK